MSKKDSEDRKREKLDKRERERKEDKTRKEYREMTGEIRRSWWSRSPFKPKRRK